MPSIEHPERIGARSVIEEKHYVPYMIRIIKKICLISAIGLARTTSVQSDSSGFADADNTLDNIQSIDLDWESLKVGLLVTNFYQSFLICCEDVRPYSGSSPCSRCC